MGARFVLEFQPIVPLIQHICINSTTLCMHIRKISHLVGYSMVPRLRGIAMILGLAKWKDCQKCSCRNISIEKRLAGDCVQADLECRGYPGQAARSKILEWEPGMDSGSDQARAGKVERASSSWAAPMRRARRPPGDTRAEATGRIV